MKITVVGCSGSFAGPDSPASCYLLQARDAVNREWSLVLDMGSGSLGTLQNFLDPSEIDAVLISHLHPDHCVDLSGLRVWREYHPERSHERLPVHLPVGGPQYINAICAGGEEAEDSAVFDYHLWEDAPSFKFGPFTVESLPVNHPVPAVGMRISAFSKNADRDVTFCFSGDTDVSDNLVTLATGVDLFFVEAGFTEARDEPHGIHLTGRRAGEVAMRAGAKRTVLTHIPPWNDRQEILAEARDVMGDSDALELASPGAVYRL